jgi:hypothetical protein
MAPYELAEPALHITTFASNNDNTTSAGPKIVLFDMDRSHLLHFA